MFSIKSKANNQSSKINFYEQHPYDEFWIGREYEHESEVIALKRLLKGRHFKVALDYGGGYGRLCSLLADYADEVILTDPSSSLLKLGQSQNPGLKTLLLKTNADIPVKDSSIDLLTMIRVMHHLKEPKANFKEIRRVLKPGGLAIIEVANSAHALNKLKYLAKLKVVPKTPIPVGTASNGLQEDTPFVNHNSKTVEKELQASGFKIKNVLSVSNLRSGFIKNHLSQSILLPIEKHSQKALASIAFGPSMFILVEKVS